MGVSNAHISSEAIANNKACSAGATILTLKGRAIGKS
jgi:hypothetical protein